ncbi:MAG: hypothetical protein CHKLHMKO_00667 [Candidatus Argoarchaeum ethanivorans]|uniref:Uncharacterized protein n=1 Tax=Candidatus Argoarchaeum ethanivorans TaxID=2608793 RepID=A0A811T9V5_9EURY|nr:MAG: hypothetical protein CHKLHMKO_00667 [Candidatus Argoarchaeum ethanivorans]
MKVKQHKTDDRKTMNDALITLLRAGSLSRFWSDVK